MMSLYRWAYKQSGRRKRERSPRCAQKSPVYPHIRKRALYNRKRALYIRKRALCIVYPQKSSVYLPKSPVHPQKRPVYPHKSTYIRKRALYIRKRALYIHKRALTHMKDRCTSHIWMSESEIFSSLFHEWVMVQASQSKTTSSHGICRRVLKKKLQVTGRWLSKKIGALPFPFEKKKKRT